MIHWQLPKVLQIDAWDEEDDSWLQSTLRFIAREARELRPGGETVITHVIRSAALTMSDPADLINLAIETLIKANVELPAFSALDRVVGHLRQEVHATLYQSITADLTRKLSTALDLLRDGTSDPGCALEIVGRAPIDAHVGEVRGTRLYAYGRGGFYAAEVSDPANMTVTGQLDLDVAGIPIGVSASDSLAWNFVSRSMSVTSTSTPPNGRMRAKPCLPNLLE